MTVEQPSVMFTLPIVSTSMPEHYESHSRIFVGADGLS